MAVIKKSDLYFNKTSMKVTELSIFDTKTFLYKFSDNFAYSNFFKENDFIYSLELLLKDYDIECLITLNYDFNTSVSHIEILEYEQMIVTHKKVHNHFYNYGGLCIKTNGKLSMQHISEIVKKLDNFVDICVPDCFILRVIISLKDLNNFIDNIKTIIEKEINISYNYMQDEKAIVLFKVKDKLDFVKLKLMFG